MIDFGLIRTLRDEAEYDAALAAVRPYFEDEPDPGRRNRRISTPWCC